MHSSTRLALQTVAFSLSYFMSIISCFSFSVAVLTFCDERKTYHDGLVSGVELYFAVEHVVQGVHDDLGGLLLDELLISLLDHVNLCNSADSSAQKWQVQKGLVILRVWNGEISARRLLTTFWWAVEKC